MRVLALFLPAGQRIGFRVPFACVQCLVFITITICYCYTFGSTAIYIIFSADEALDECGTEAPCKHLVQLLQI